MLLVGVMCFVLWTTGIATSHTMGGFIHVLLVLAIVALMSRMIRSNSSTKLAEWRASVPQPDTSGSDR
jgi:hypothetical protein